MGFIDCLRTGNIQQEVSKNKDADYENETTRKLPAPVYYDEATEGGQTYYFSPMTLEIYNTRVKDRLLGKREFDNEEEMIKAFLEE